MNTQFDTTKAQAIEATEEAMDHFEPQLEALGLAREEIRVQIIHHVYASLVENIASQQ